MDFLFKIYVIMAGIVFISTLAVRLIMHTIPEVNQKDKNVVSFLVVSSLIWPFIITVGIGYLLYKVGIITVFKEAINFLKKGK